MIVDGKEVELEQVQLSGAGIASIITQTPLIVEDYLFCMAMISTMIDVFCEKHKKDPKEFCEEVGRAVTDCRRMCEIEELFRCSDV